MFINDSLNAKNLKSSVQELERRRKNEKERLEREWELARVRSDNQENIGNNGGKQGSAGKKRVT